MSDVHYRVRAYLRQNGETNMLNFALDDSENIANWGYDIPQPTTEMLANVPQCHIDFVSNDYYARDIYTATETVTTGLWQALPLISLRYPCVTVHMSTTTIALSAGFWRLSVYGISNGDATIRIIDADGIINRIINAPSGEFDSSRAIYISDRTDLRIEAKKRGNTSVELNLTLIIEEL
jgi:hypothetical protein